MAVGDSGTYVPPRYASQAIAWGSTGSMSVLGVLPGNIDTSASGVSTAGAVIVGSSSTNYNLTTTQAFRWAAGTGITGMGFLAGNTWSYASDVSANGHIVAGNSGSSSVGSQIFGSQAARWSTTDNACTGLGYLPGVTALQPYSSSTGISSDGLTIVGASSSPNAQPWPLPSPNSFFTGMEAFRWTQSTGMLGLGDLAGGIFSSTASGASADGSVIVGAGTLILPKALRTPSVGPRTAACKA